MLQDSDDITHKIHFRLFNEVALKQFKLTQKQNSWAKFSCNHVNK